MQVLLDENIHELAVPKFVPKLSPQRRKLIEFLRIASTSYVIHVLECHRLIHRLMDFQDLNVLPYLRVQELKICIL